MTDRDALIKGIQECNLNGGRIGNCPYKGIIDLLKEQEEEIEKAREIIEECHKIADEILAKRS